MRIRVIEQIPVATVTVAGRQIEVAGDGTLLHADSGAGSLPTIPLSVAPGGPRLTGWALGAVAVLAAAPYQLLPHISQVANDPGHGLTAQVRGGPSIYFGSASRLGAKWTAATAVLADHSSIGADYIDVSDPARPAAGVTGVQGAAVGGEANPQLELYPLKMPSLRRLSRVVGSATNVAEPPAALTSRATRP